MSKFKNGFVTGVKKEEAQKAEQRNLHKKHHVADKNVVIVEKDNMAKFTIRSIGRLIQIVAAIVLCILAAIGLLTMLYPTLRVEFLDIMSRIYRDVVLMIRG